MMDYKDDAKKDTLRQLIRQMQDLMASGQGEKEQNVGETLADVGEDTGQSLGSPEPEEMSDGEYCDEENDKKSFMKGMRKRPKGKSITILSTSVSKKPSAIGKGKKYG